MAAEQLEQENTTDYPAWVGALTAALDTMLSRGEIARTAKSLTWLANKIEKEKPGSATLRILLKTIRDYQK